MLTTPTQPTLLALLTILLTLTSAQDLPAIEYTQPIPSNIVLTPSNLQIQNNMMTRSLEWHNGMAQAFIASSTDHIGSWGSFDTTFPSPQFWTVNLYKYAEGGYESARDCHAACEAYLGQAIGAGVQTFQCDHRPGGNTHCWMGYRPTPPS